MENRRVNLNDLIQPPGSDKDIIISEDSLHHSFHATHHIYAFLDLNSMRIFSALGSEKHTGIVRKDEQRVLCIPIEYMHCALE